MRQYFDKLVKIPLLTFWKKPREHIGVTGWSFVSQVYYNNDFGAGLISGVMTVIQN